MSCQKFRKPRTSPADKRCRESSMVALLANNTMVFNQITGGSAAGTQSWPDLRTKYAVARAMKKIVMETMARRIAV